MDKSKIVILDLANENDIGQTSSGEQQNYRKSSCRNHMPTHQESESKDYNDNDGS